jgi:hypothetical protein
MMSDKSLERFAYYWVKFSTPEGPAEWRPAQFYEKRNGSNRWFLIGYEGEARQIHTVGASNQWEVGDKLDLPD